MFRQKVCIYFLGKRQRPHNLLTPCSLRLLSIETDNGGFASRLWSHPDKVRPPLILSEGIATDSTLPGGTRDRVGAVFGRGKLPLAGAESEASSTIGTLDGLVLKAHWMTSSLLIQLEFGPSNT